MISKACITIGVICAIAGISPPLKGGGTKEGIIINIRSGIIQNQVAMVIKERKVSKPVHGDKKAVMSFAWWPTWVANQLIWLAKYERVYEFRVRRRWVDPSIGHYHFSGFYAVYGKWELISEKKL